MVSRPHDRYPDMWWSGWGERSHVPALPESVLALLRDGLGVSRSSGAPQPIADVELPVPRLDDADVAALAAVADVRSDPQARILHTRGKSTPDLLRMRAHDVHGAPDLVLLPGSHEEVVEVLRVCSARRIAVVPFGGGTSVVGGLAPEAQSYGGVVALDLRRMNGLRALDEESRVAELEPGLRGPEAEALLRERGYTLGHFPQSFEYATVGGFAAARSSGQSSAGYGRFDELVVTLRVATPAGTLVLGRAPRSAAGPDLRQLMLGSEGAFGVITSVGVRARPSPEHRVYEGWRFGSFLDGAAAVRRLAQDGPLPTVLRLSDEAETALGLAQPDELGAGAAGSLAIVGYEGAREEVAVRQSAAGEVLRAAGAEGPDREAGAGWERERFRGPYLRDALLDAGALVETLETACFWSALPALYRAVGEALRDSLTAAGTPPVVLCHISHVYATGASLYFTVGCAQSSDPVEQWRVAKAAASDAIVSAGGSITHHHGVGRDHAPWLAAEIGELGVDVLRVVKARLDPAGIMNPGVLVPPPLSGPGA